MGSSRSCISDREKRLRILKRCFHRFSLISGEVGRDPYNFDFFTLRKQAAERELEEWLLAHIRKSLIEPGAGFAFVGQQVHLEVAGGDFYIDLLFYHLKPRRYIAIDLKTTAFKPEYAGKMNFYLSAIDDQMRHIDDDLSIGLILCKTRSKVIAEYALRNVGEPMGIARYTTKLREALPNDLKGSLPSPKELEDELLVDNAKKRRDGPNRSWTMTPRDDSLSNDADAGGENAAASGGKFETDERALAREQAAADSRTPLGISHLASRPL